MDKLLQLKKSQDVMSPLKMLQMLQLTINNQMLSKESSTFHTKKFNIKLAKIECGRLLIMILKGLKLYKTIVECTLERICLLVSVQEKDRHTSMILPAI